MKRISVILVAFLTQLFFQTSFAHTTAPLFNVSAQGTTLTFTPKANHSYPQVGMLITSSDYSLSKPTTQCTNWPNTQGYCQFAASQSKPASISINGSVGTLSFKLCLNSLGKITCQNYCIAIVSKSCAASGGKTVAGSDACWIQTRVNNPSQIIRCSTRCNAVGMELVQPGPTNNSILAGNVCAAFGFADPLFQGAPGPITHISIVELPGFNFCAWDDLSGVDWDNPNNVSFGATGYSFCPCR
jgi:hypothetical protein